MTVTEPENAAQEQKQTDKELNFRRLEAKYQQEVAYERGKREEIEKRMQELSQQKPVEPEEDDSEPYVDHKKLNKSLSKFGQNTQTEINKAMQQAKQDAKEELKQEMFLENHPDFYQVLEHAEKFSLKHEKLANHILKMPAGFARQQLVYETIKEMGIDKPEVKQQTIQEKVDANRRAPYYQPSGVGTSPYASQSDFSPGGQKQAYDKMKELQSRLRL
jgi:hypothetical protein